MMLQACPFCSRQYDVAHLEPGSFVRCICEERFSVKPSRELRVRGLRCRHCGAPIAAEEESCPYCTAALDERDRNSSLCPGCFTRIDADAAHCSGCGTRIDPQALPPIPSGRDCPRCKGALQIRSLDVACVIECTDCGGLWLDPDVFKQVCRDARRDNFNLPQSNETAHKPVLAARIQSYIPCLDCGELMLRRQFTHRARPTGIVLDYCRSHGVWFDGEELVSILARIHNGAENAPDAGLLEEALSPPVKVRTLPEGMQPGPPKPYKASYRDVLRTIGDLLF